MYGVVSTQKRADPERQIYNEFIKPDTDKLLPYKHANKTSFNMMDKLALLRHYFQISTTNYNLPSDFFSDGVFDLQPSIDLYEPWVVLGIHKELYGTSILQLVNTATY